MSLTKVEFGEGTGSERGFADVEKRVREMIAGLSWVRGYINVKSLDDEDIKQLKSLADWTKKLEKECRTLSKAVSKVQ